MLAIVAHLGSSTGKVSVVKLKKETDLLLMMSVYLHFKWQGFFQVMNKKKQRKVILCIHIVMLFRDVIDY